MTTLEDLERLFATADPESRRRATVEIPRLPRPESLRYLVRALGDPDWRVRKEAGQIALQLERSPDLAAALARLLLPGDNVGLRNAAVETLAALGGGAVPAVADVLAELDADGRKLAVEVLGACHDPRAISVLAPLIGDADVNVRIACLEAIGRVGPLAIDNAAILLFQGLGFPEPQVRLAALNALNELGIVVPWAMLDELREARVLKRALLEAASRSGHVDAAVFLTETLGEEQRSMFAYALRGLAELILANPDRVPELLQCGLVLSLSSRKRLLDCLSPDSDDPDSRRAALVVAALFDEAHGVDVAIDALVDDQAAAEANHALRIFGSKAVPRLLARLAHGDAALRAAAIDLVVTLTDSAHLEGVRAALRTAVGDSSPDVASAALRGLALIGDPADLSHTFALVTAQGPCSMASEDAFLLLVRRFPEEAKELARSAPKSERYQLAVSILLGALGGEVFGSVADDVQFLAQALSSGHPRTRHIAVSSLARMGSDLALEAVQFALADEEREIQMAALLALGQIRSASGECVGASRLIDLLARLTEPDLLSTAIRALGEARDPRAISPIASHLRSPSPLVAVSVVQALSRYREGEARATLLEASVHPHAEVVKAALLCIEGWDRTLVIPHLGRALEHAAWDVRRLAADCLGRAGGPAAAERLRAQATREGEPLVLEAIDRSLAAIENPNTPRHRATMTPPQAGS